MNRFVRLLSSGRELEHLLSSRLRFSKQFSRFVTKFLRVALSPKQFVLRRHLAHSVHAEDQAMLQTLREKGAVTRSPGALAGTADLLDFCIKTAERRLSDKTRYAALGRKHLINLLDKEDLLSSGVFFEFALQERLVSIISQYLRTIPILTDIQLWWSSQNSTLTGSQQFHFDQEDLSTVRVFLNVSDVTERAGPLTYFDKKQSGTIKAKAPNWFRRIDDSLIRNLDLEKDAATLTGPSGTISIIDTAKCCHMGSRNNQEDRLVLMLHFTPFHSIKEGFSYLIADVLGDNRWPLSELANHRWLNLVIPKCQPSFVLRRKMKDSFLL